MVETGNLFMQQNRTLITRVLSQTRYLLMDSKADGFDDMMEFAGGAYQVKNERYPRAVYITQDTLPEERDGGIAEPPSCRIRHGAILPSSTSTIMDLLVLADLNCSAFRTELWLPWLYCSPKIVTEGHFQPSHRGGSQGSLYVSRAELGMQPILEKLKYVENYIDPKSARSDSSSTQKMVIPRARGGVFANLEPSIPRIVASLESWAGEVNPSDATDVSDRVSATQKIKLARAS